jgi:hypothetical protein
MGMVAAHSEPTEIHSRRHSRIIETIYHDNKWVSTMKKGGFVPDMDHLMNFWGTPKRKKFLNISIKVYEDEICSTSVWYR